ncbi:MAG: putative uncharacterized glycosyltransferase [Prokaryotic dsDNA virus sp.]|mgnify:CR=1 FL=1|nr:MAG: putative uncharacterized glycosyltransferase [Prokaryotic dsDNA virus sp.]|tara:strand:- start:2686 stop:3408 length:723 start_codon:yes stop_codon:yes gene_type:complete
MIPKKIHQIYFDLHGKDISEIPLFNESHSRIKNLYPDFEYKLWSEEECDELIKNNLPKEYDFYKSMRYDIQRIDYVRFVILYFLGGVYVDLDLIPIRRINDILDRPFFSYSLRGLIPNHNEFVQNDFMGSKKGFELWKVLIDNCQKNYKAKSDMEVYNVRKARFVLYTTGPRYMGKIMKKVMPNYQPAKDYIFTKWKNDKWKKVERNHYYFENYVSCSWAHSVNPKLHIKDTFYLKSEEI